MWPASVGSPSSPQALAKGLGEAGIAYPSSSWPEGWSPQWPGEPDQNRSTR
jgi:hypothetical protein